MIDLGSVLDDGTEPRRGTAQKAPRAPAAGVPAAKRARSGSAESDAESGSEGAGGAAAGRKRTKPRRARPGVRALREIRVLQRTTNLLIPRLPFARVVREEFERWYAPDVGGVCKWQAEALLVMQEAAEAYLVQLFEDSYLCAFHAKRVTLTQRDIQLARRIRGPAKEGLW